MQTTVIGKGYGVGGKGYEKVKDAGAPLKDTGAQEKLGVAIDGLTVGCPRESFPGERRVAVAPAAIKLLSKEGFKVQVEKGAGEQANFTDAMLAAEGASIVDGRTAWNADILPTIASVWCMRCVEKSGEGVDSCTRARLARAAAVSEDHSAQ